jgi:hypothetical protein
VHGDGLAWARLKQSPQQRFRKLFVSWSHFFEPKSFWTFCWPGSHFVHVYADATLAPSHPHPQLQYTRAKSRQFAYWRRFFTFGGRSGTRGGEAPRDWGSMYITYSYNLGLVWLGLVSSNLEESCVPPLWSWWRCVFTLQWTTSSICRRWIQFELLRYLWRGFTILVGGNCFRFVYQLIGKPAWILRLQIPRNLVMRWPRAIF